MTKREELYLKGMEMIKQFAELNLKPIINKSYIDVFKEHNMNEIYYERAKKRIEK